MFYIIPKDSKNQRLDKFLSIQSKFPRSQIQKIIKQKGMFINKKRIKIPHYFLKEGDRVEFSLTRQNVKDLLKTDSKSKKFYKETFTQLSADTNKLTILTAKNQPKIIFDCPYYAIIDKPAGMIIHHPKNNNYKEEITFPQNLSLVDWLIKKYPEVQKVGDDTKNRPGIVHRLDKEVSGIIVVAKTQKMFLHLKEQFKQRKIKKEYIALVYGKIAQNEGVINFPIARSKKGIKMAALPIKLNKNGQTNQSLPYKIKSAKTYFEVIKKFQHYTFLKIKPKTGRTNQIRVHLNAISHPIVGEKLYIPKNLKKKQKFDRLFLQSKKLGFFDLNGEWQEYKVALRIDLQKFLDQLRN